VKKHSLFLWRIAILFSLCASLTMQVRGQSTTSGAIAGTVFDTANTVVANASVLIHNDATNAETQLKTDNSGYYKAPLLEPGTYTVSVSGEGFAAFRANNVTVLVGEATELDPHLTISTSATVEVTAEAPVLNFESPDFSGVVNKTTLNSLPINNRRWSALAMTTPGVVSDSNGYGLISVRGVSPLLNNVEIDGADDNQAFFSEERGRTREAYSTSASAVQEFQINTGVYSAEYGRAAGAVINSVTQSGTNQLHGTLYGWDRESKWNAYNAFAKISVLNPATGAYVSTPIKPEDLRKIYGFTVGGPLIKNKLWWMYTFDQHDHIFPGVGVPTSPATFYALPDTALPSGTCNTATGYLSGSTSSNANYTLDSYTCTMAARLGLTYSAAASTYATAITNLTTALGTVHRTGDQSINTPKLDYQINDKEHLSALYHRLRWDSPGGVQTSATTAYATDTWGNDYVKLDYGLIKLNSLLTSKISNELLYQYGRELDYETQQPFNAYTQANLVGTGGNVPEVNLDESSAGFYLGSPYYSYRTAYPYETKWQVADTLYYQAGNHTLKFGGDVVHNYDLINNTYESNGEYVYSYISTYVTDLLAKGRGTCNSSGTPSQTSATGTSVLGTYPCYADYYQGFGPPVFAISTLDYGVFAQDNWKISPRLTLELGLRYDYEFTPSPRTNLTTAVGSFVPYSQLLNHPSDKNNFGPRIGFAYDVYGKGNTVLRGGFGMYYGRITNGNIEEILSETGSPNGQYTSTYRSSTAGAPLFPNPVSTAGKAPTPNSYFFASNLQNPMAFEWDLMLQQAVGKGTVFQVSYLGASGRELPNFLDLNLNPATTNYTITVADSTGKGPLPNGAVYTVPTFTGYGNSGVFGSAAANFDAITEMTSNINSSYNALVGEIQNHSLHSVQFDASYTWSHALDFAQNADTEGTGNNWYNPYGDPRINYGNSSYNVPNRFVGWVLYNFPNQPGGSWTKYLTNDWNLDNSFQMQNGLPYSAEASGFVGNAILNYWNGSSGQEIVPQIGINTEKTPRKIVDDVRVQKSIPFKERYNLQLMANFFNIANHQNIDGINEVAYKLTTSSQSSTAGIATYQSTFGQATSSNNSGFLYTPREIEVSARFTF
jgi:Carboxypeptidase regulatory-like domain/TonB-dependent Receptor Plug Domain